jgi:hypothetical protein
MVRPWPVPVIPAVPDDVRYGLGRIDESGRVADRTITSALGWHAGDRLTLTAAAGVVIARRDPAGMVTMPARPYIAIPAAEGYPVRDRASSSYIAAFEPAGVFADLVKAEGIRRGADHVRHPPHALPLVPLPRPVHRLRRRRGRLQNDRRPAPQAVRHALDYRRSRPDHHPALRRGQQPMGDRLPQPSQPDRRRQTSPHPKTIFSPLQN